VIDGRIARTVVLLVWASFFAYLWLTGEMTRYLGPRTYWVVPFGMATLVGAAAIHVATLRSRSPRKLSPGQIGGLSVLLIPIVAVVVVPRPDLGALAASRKATGVGAAAGYMAPPASSDAEPSFIDVHFANESPEYGTKRGVVEGRALDLVGFVSRSPASPGGAFELSRFYVSCCAADAIPYSVVVDPAGSSVDFSADTWLSVSGVLRRGPGGFELEARSIREVKEPRDPYL
jgi:uncharacterized repeat protein (TIGR03943 family)